MYQNKKSLDIEYFNFIILRLIFHIFLLSHIKKEFNVYIIKKNLNFNTKYIKIRNIYFKTKEIKN